METKDILAFKKLAASITGNDANNISGNTLSEIVDSCVFTVVLKDGNEASKVSHVKSNNYLINPETGTFYTAASDDFDYWKVVSADTNQESYKCYNRNFNIKITESCAVVAIYKNQQTMRTVSIKDGDNSVIQAIVPDGELLVDSANDFYEAAGPNFAYWSVFTSDDGREVSRHYYKNFTQIIYDNYTIVAVYNTEPKSFLGISKPQYTREQYTDDSGNAVDRIYANFILSYSSASNELIKDNPDKYKTGVLIEIAYEDENKLADGQTDFSGISYASDEVKLLEATKLNHSKYIDIIPNSGSASTTLPTADRRIINYVATSSLYNNFNRLQYAVYFKNTANNQKYVMKAYYYVYNTETDETIITYDNPVYFNIKEIGTSTPTTVTTNS